jgi:hypothetical protein
MDTQEIIGMLAIIDARLDAWLTDLKNNRKETMACLEKTEACLEVEEEPASVDMTPEVAHGQEAQPEDAEVMPVGEPRKRRPDQRRNLAAVRRQKKKDRILDARCRGKEQERAQRKNRCLKNLVAARRRTTRRAAMARRRILPTKDTNRELHGSQKRLVAARRGTTRCAGRARHKEDFIGRSRDKDSGVLRTSKGWTLGRKQRAQQQHNTGTKNPGAKWQQRLRNEKTAGRIARKSHEKTRLEIVRQIAGSLVGLHDIEHWTLWRGRPPPKRKK